MTLGHGEDSHARLRVCHRLCQLSCALDHPNVLHKVTQFATPHTDHRWNILGVVTTIIRKLSDGRVIISKFD